jgi:intein/homing endonuclease
MLPSTTAISVNSEIHDMEYIVKSMTSVEMNIESYNIKNKKLTSSNVVATRSSSSKDFIYIQIESGESIILTHDHKIYTNNEWIRADKIPTGSTILNSKLNQLKVIEMHKIHNDISQKVYNLTIEDTQCFFANDMLVHNDS